MKEEKLYIVLIRGNTVLSKLIRWTTQAEYTHAAISLDKDLNYMYSFSRRYTNNPFFGCFRNENFDEGVYANFCKIPGSIFELTVTKDEYNHVSSIIADFLVNQHLYKYNYLGLVSNLAKINISRHNRFFCSEFVYHVLHKCGICDFGLPRSFVRPENLAQMIDGRIIYEGDLRQYVKAISLNKCINGNMCANSKFIYYICGFLTFLYFAGYIIGSLVAHMTL